LALGVTGLVLAGLAFSAAAEEASHPDLAGLSLPSDELIGGFTADTADSGPLNTAEALETVGLTPEAAALARGYRTVWREAASSTASVLVLDLGADRRVQPMLGELRSKLRGAGVTVTEMASVSGSIAADTRLQESDGTQVDVALGDFGRGSLVVLALAAAPPATGSANLDAVRNKLADDEAALLDARYGGAVVESDSYEAAGFLAGAIVGYLLIVGAVARFRDPLRRGRRVSGPAPWPDGSADRMWATDVSRQASRRRWAAVARLGFELAAFTLAGAAVLEQDLPTRLVLAGGAVGIWLVLGVRRWRGVVHGGPITWAGVRATLWTVAALITALGAVAVLAVAALSQQDPGGGQSLGAGMCLVAAGGISQRRARRVRARTADQVQAGDSRPIVLFLRSFGDDRCRLRTAALGRRSWLEKLAPVRFDSFEEVLTRHLSVVGPVVAVNPPGTDLPPIGAARATIAHGEWQTTVDAWMTQAQLVVVSAPPETVTPGLMWELDNITRRGLWGRTLVVVPPVPAGEIRRRWWVLGAARRAWPFDMPLPVDPAQVLALHVRNGRWAAEHADQRTEWTYAAALDVALERSGERVPRPS
jgi:hypothetical protein